MRTRQALSFLLCGLLLAQQKQEAPVFKAAANLVVVTVFVRGRDGKPVENLSKDDFTVMENGKPQAVAVFEFEQLGAEPALTAPQRLLQRGEEKEKKAEAPVPPPVEKEGSTRFQDRRLLILFFDWSALPDTDQIRAIEAADKFVREQMTASDLMSIKTFGSTLKTEVDFTGDRDALLAAIRKFLPGQAGELGEAATEGETTEDDEFVADLTEFNLFNTDRKLGAIEDIARSVQAIPEKKALIYFASGMSKTGMDNESQMRATINAAVRANVSLYPIDVRGLMAAPAGGAASERGPRGNALYTGSGQTRNMRSRSDSQDTLYNLAADTGGKALLDENDLAMGIRQAQQDIQSYYVLGYYSTDDRRDGQFRKVEVKLAKPGLQARLDYRAGYFAAKEFKAFSAYDRERQLQDALLLGDPVTDLPLALEVNHFRLDKSNYFVPLALKIPGSAVPTAKKGASETARFEFLAEIRTPKGTLAANVRDEIKIQLRDENAGKLAVRNLLYDTGFVLPPGSYKVKMLVRENESGKMGTFETRYEVPDVTEAKDTVKLSSVVWSSQRQAVSGAVGIADKKLKKQESHPLVRNGQKLIPSVTRVFRADQSLYVYAEVYDASLNVDNDRPAVAAQVTLYRAGKKVLESRPVRVEQMMVTRWKTTPLSLEISLRGLPPGRYTAQLNVIDQAGQRFVIERAQLVIVKPS